MPIRFHFLTAIACSAALLPGCDLFNEPKKPVAQGPAPVAPEAPNSPEMEMVKAGVGVGKKGDSLRDDPNQIIVGPAVAYFNTKEKVVFEIQIPHAINLYNADKGYYPRTHEEFMTDIVEFNQIKLPELKPGAKYVYDPETHTLMVEQPVKPQPPQ